MNRFAMTLVVALGLVGGLLGLSAGRTAAACVGDCDLKVAVHPNITGVNATSPAGAVVTYTTPAVTDEETPLPPVICAPVSGSTFKIGTTTVTCTATSAEDANSPATSTFTVTVLDNDLKLATHANITVDATSPAGAVVTYTTPAATDEDAAPVTCAPASGATFKIGTTTVTCTATSADDLNNPVHTTFTVTVRGASAQLAALLAKVQAANIDLGNSLTAKLENAQDRLTAGQTNAACGLLTAFVNETEAQMGKEIPNSVATAWMKSATQIMNVLGC
jgi:hypothetical protein